MRVPTSVIGAIGDPPLVELRCIRDKIDFGGCSPAKPATAAKLQQRPKTGGTIAMVVCGGRSKNLSTDLWEDAA